ncbi:MAG: EAL domain-containing protein [Roseibium sp.]|uniref:bifunctional diguanylate cyclase/phosphodiesterase n=1 Tax=Roseibium sp. TaxID=1936156 RepID=UPI001B220578|nr:EAL domain-containing protein [Roseibium sp.]MBO6890609.1 EAL domain-containing protein [Roseibium sp.]MBO6932405.1 EAL domain-containing protein [Roseibium sp.]
MGDQGKEDWDNQRTGQEPGSRWLDRIVARWGSDETHFETPLRIVFLSFLALTVSILTLQNVFTEYRNLNESQDVTVQTAESLLMQQKALASQALDQALRSVRSNTELQNAIVQQDSAEITKIAKQVFAKKGEGLDIVELTIFGADQTAIFQSDNPDPPNPYDSAPSNTMEFDVSDLENGISFTDDNQLVASVLRPWTSSGQLVGFLKLSLNVERSLTLASSAVDAQILKICEIPAKNEEASTSVHYEVLGNNAPPGFNIAGVSAASSMPGDLNQFVIEDGKVFLVRDLPIRVLNNTHAVKLALVKDVTANVWAFAKRTLISILAGLGLALLSWSVVKRLLKKLQGSVETTRARLEAEVLENTQKLERSALQLLDAQRIANVGSWETDLATGKVHGSEEFYRIWRVPMGLTASEMHYDICSRTPEHEAEQAKNAIRSAVEECGKFEFENTMVLEDGSVRYLEARGYVMAGADGKAAKIIGIVHDITDRFKTERQNQLLANILESSLNEIYILDAKTFRIDYANACALENLGYGLEELKSHRIWHINPVYDEQKVQRHLAPLLKGQRTSLSVESMHKRKDGSEYPVDLRVQLLHDHERELLVAIANDVSERVQRENETREAKVRAERLAYYDPLTKLSNRAGCQRDARERFDKPNKPAFLIHVDMDNFKRVNDSLGHLAGDHCLAETGRRLREVCRGLATPYRWGGDEFVILANSSTADPNELCERARRIMRDPMEYNGNRFWPTVSMGIALCPDDAEDFETLLVNADLALYQSKEDGKDRYSFFKPDMKADIETEAQIGLELHDALKNGEFFLEYQPQVNLRSQAVTGVEALIRWQHPERGVVSPGEFLPVVEKNSLAPMLGEFVVDQSLAAARHWLDTGLEFGRISINISPSHLASGLLVDHFRAAMDRHGVGPERITAEVLESVFLDDDRAGHLAALEELYNLGVHIELDDFGTGYASLTHVADMPINGLKIDRSFTNQMLEDPKKEAVVNQLIHLARSLNIGIVCEGVETEAQYDRLRMMGDFSIQGYLIARPMSFDKITDWMSESADDLYFVI